MSAAQAHSSVRIERIDAANVRVDGEIGFADAREAVARTDDLFGGGSNLTIDLGGLTRADSATLGVLLIWAAAAAVRGVRVRFARAPAGLQPLARLCDTEALLGLA